ncbi:MAG: DEAD/DEAH box helicase [Anaerovoracaceae bacterium]
MSIADKLSLGLQSGFVDCNLTSLERYNPKLIINNHKKGVKVLTSIENELQKCEEFYFSVAFITQGGVASLLSILTELEEKGLKGKIVTSQYQDFTDPKALRRLLEFDNIELRIVTDGNFHAKGYIFKRSDSYSFILGSSNLTQNALGYNKEWNVKLSSLREGSVMQSILKEFKYTFDNAIAVDEEFLQAYSEIYNSRFAVTKTAAISQSVTQLNRINPNKMQIEALKGIEILRNDGEEKALLISATGTGKTFLSAFDVKKVAPKKFLFVVHRGNIARTAMDSFKKVLGNHIDCGLVTGGKFEIDKQYVFATIQTIAKEENLQKIDPEEFEYIVIDEVHRSGAKTYQNMLNYFKPKFMLGMTATPERTDGFNIFEAFDHNIAYEIRLSDALEENMLVPFHYYGVSEIFVDGKLLDENAEFGKLVSEERVKRVIEKINYYGHYGNRVKGLIFCSRVEEAEEFSAQFNGLGYKTVALSGKDSEVERDEVIERLNSDHRDDYLEYVFTVDIFNEGIDIPTVNQIVMLRPTQSAIVFVQQLGRGLRKAFGKEYLTVIDFIGNYKNNFMIPIALHGDRSYNKDTIRKLVNSGSGTIPGSSTVHFDRITKERIYEAIDTAKLNVLKTLREDYSMLKHQLGRIPMMVDFLDHGRRDAYGFVNYSGSYYSFLKKSEKEFDMKLSHEEEVFLTFLSKEALDGKRIEECILIVLLMAKGKTSIEEVKELVFEGYGYKPSTETVLSAVKVLNGEFLTGNDIVKYSRNRELYVNDENKIIDYNGNFVSKSEVLSLFIMDNLNYTLKKVKKEMDLDLFRNGFILYNKYTRKDVCRILNWDKNESSTVYGYRIKHNTCPIFVTYHKEDNISESTKYRDSFINQNVFSWMTRNGVSKKSKEVTEIKNWDESGLRIPLFIKKSDNEGSDFYYMGDVEPIDFEEERILNDKGKSLPIVNITFKMKDEVEEGIYNYLEAK